jgi:hypothetical protein
MLLGDSSAHQLSSGVFCDGSQWVVHVWAQPDNRVLRMQGRSSDQEHSGCCQEHDAEPLHAVYCTAATQAAAWQQSCMP